MRQRLISAAVLVPVVVLAFLLGQPWLTLFVALVAAAAAWETARLVRLAGLGCEPVRAVVLSGGAVALAPYAATYRGDLQAFAVVGFFAAVIVLSAFAALRQPQPADGFRVWVGTVISIGYPTLLAALTAVLGRTPFRPADSPFAGLDPGRMWVLILVLTIWSLDSVAYLAGRYHGRGRFMNHISPNKTWSGAIAGAIAAVVVCAALTVAAGQSVIAGVVLGFVIAVVAQAGDLTESMIKRAAGVKDSGSLLPGHGGVLDRVDSFLFAAPVMLVAVVWFQTLPVPNLGTPI